MESLEVGKEKATRVEVSWRSMNDVEKLMIAVGNLTTQRNAIKMLYDRIAVISEYISGVANSKLLYPFIHGDNANAQRPSHQITIS
jgi:hypothetical protein